MKEYKWTFTKKDMKKILKATRGQDLSFELSSVYFGDTDVIQYYIFGKKDDMVVFHYPLGIVKADDNVNLWDDDLKFFESVLESQERRIVALYELNRDLVKEKDLKETVNGSVFFLLAIFMCGVSVGCLICFVIDLLCLLLK